VEKPSLTIGQLWHSEVYEEVVQIYSVDIEGVQIRTKCYTDGNGCSPKKMLDASAPVHFLSYVHFFARYRPINKLTRYLYGLEEDHELR
jgi:hypothetical protein